MGSVILDKPITQHKVPKMFRTLPVANRPPVAPKRCICVRVTLVGAWVVAVAVLFGSGWSKREVGRVFIGAAPPLVPSQACLPSTPPRLVETSP